MRIARQAGVTVRELADHYGVGTKIASEAIRGLGRFEHVGEVPPVLSAQPIGREQRDLLPIRRACTDALPTLPRRAAGDDPGARVFGLLVHALAGCT